MNIGDSIRQGCLCFRLIENGMSDMLLAMYPCHRAASLFDLFRLGCIALEHWKKPNFDRTVEDEPSRRRNCKIVGPTNL